MSLAMSSDLTSLVKLCKLERPCRLSPLEIASPASSQAVCSMTAARSPSMSRPPRTSCGRYRRELPTRKLLPSVAGELPSNCFKSLILISITGFGPQSKHCFTQHVWVLSNLRRRSTKNNGSSSTAVVVSFSHPSRQNSAQLTHCRLCWTVRHPTSASGRIQGRDCCLRAQLRPLHIVGSRCRI